MAIVRPDIPPDFRNAYFDSVAYSERPPSYFTDENWQPIRGQAHLNELCTRASEGFTISDEDTDPGLGAEQIPGGQNYVDEGALRTDPATPGLWDKLKSGK